MRGQQAMLLPFKTIWMFKYGVPDNHFNKTTTPQGKLLLILVSILVIFLGLSIIIPACLVAQFETYKV